MASSKVDFILTGGGTAGHINPALAVGKAILAEQADAKILYCGNKENPESDLAQRAGFNFHHIAAEPFEFSSPSFLWRAVKAFFKGRKEAMAFLKEARPQAILGTGGYVQAPLLAAAKKLHIPYVLHEQNAIPGKSVRLMSGKAQAVCVSFENTLRDFPRAKKTVYTGNPVDPIFFEDRKEALRLAQGMNPKESYVLVTGGSQGALSINTAILNLVSSLATEPALKPYKIHLVTGTRYYDEFKEKFKPYMKQVPIKLSSYVYDMADQMAISDVVIARAGAGTCSELAALHKPSILVPYPYAKGDHQRFNAETLVDRGAAMLIPDQDLDAESLRHTLDDLFNDPTKLYQMGQNAGNLAQKEAAAKIAHEVFLCTERKDED